MLNIPTSHRVALLIDADNTQLTHLDQILAITDYYDNPIICRAYGDWEQPPLSASYESVRHFNIETRQVDRIAKNTTDKQLMIEAAEILGANGADVFIIATGDGDFRQVFELIKDSGKQVIGIGNKKQTSSHLPKSCDTFYYIEDLEETLIRLEQDRLKEFEALLFRALDSMPCDKEGWFYLGSLGTVLHELDPGFKSRFGCNRLSEWLNLLNARLEINGQMVRIIDSEASERTALLREAYAQAEGTNGLANMGQVGQILRNLDSKFESHFGKKSLSEWLDEYSHIFKRQDNYVSLT